MSRLLKNKFINETISQFKINLGLLNLSYDLLLTKFDDPYTILSVNLILSNKKISDSIIATIEINRFNEYYVKFHHKFYDGMDFYFENTNVNSINEIEKTIFKLLKRSNNILNLL